MTGASRSGFGTTQLQSWARFFDRLYCPSQLPAQRPRHSAKAPCTNVSTVRMADVWQKTSDDCLEPKADIPLFIYHAVAANGRSEPRADLYLPRASRPQHFRQTPRPSGRAAVQRQKRPFVAAAASLTDAMTAMRTKPPFVFHRRMVAMAPSSPTAPHYTFRSAA